MCVSNGPRNSAKSARQRNNHKMKNIVSVKSNRFLSGLRIINPSKHIYLWARQCSDAFQKGDFAIECTGTLITPPRWLHQMYYTMVHITELRWRRIDNIVFCALCGTYIDCYCFVPWCRSAYSDSWDTQTAKQHKRTEISWILQHKSSTHWDGLGVT